MGETDLVAGIAQLGEQQTEAPFGVFWRSRVQSTVLALLLCVDAKILTP